MRTFHFRGLFVLLDLLSLDDLFDLVAQDDDKGDHDNNRNELPTAQEQEHQRQRSTSITRHISGCLANRTLCDCPVHLTI